MRQDKLLRTGALYAVRVPGFRAPVWLRAGTSDRQVFEEIVVGDELGFDVGARPDRILDLGANIGLSSVYLANRFPAARVLAVEVDAGNVALLRLNTRPYPGITVVPKAVWRHDGHVRIANPADHSWSFRVTDARPDEPGSIEAVCVDTLLRDHGWPHVDFVKMDVEGAERDLFEGAQPEWLSRVSVLAVELHDRFREGCSEALNNAIHNIPHRLVAREHYTVALLGQQAMSTAITAVHTSSKTPPRGQ
jgi:FkbM family methyltransferase